MGKLTGEDTPPVVLFSEGDVLPRLVVMQARNATAGNIYWGCGEGGRKGFVLESEGTHLDADPVEFEQDNIVVVANRSFRPDALVLIQPDPTESGDDE